MSGTAQTIILKAGLQGQPMIGERAAVAAITPGYLIEEVAAGTVQKHAGAGLNAAKKFALEKLPVGGTIDDDYATGDTVRYGTFSSGQEVNAILAASAAAIIIGSVLESAGDGTLRIATADAATDTAQRDAIVAYATEAVDNSGGGGEVRIKVRIA